MKRRAAIALGALAALIVAFLAGRFTASPEVKTTTRDVIVYAAHSEAHGATDVQQQQREKVRIVTVTRTDPSGAKEERREEDRLSGADLTLHSSWDFTESTRGERTAEATTVKSSERPGWSLGLASQWSPERLVLKPSSYSLQLDRRIFGTVWLGVRADTDKRVGAAIRVEF